MFNSPIGVNCVRQITIIEKPAEGEGSLIRTGGRVTSLTCKRVQGYLCPSQMVCDRESENDGACRARVIRKETAITITRTNKLTAKDHLAVAILVEIARQAVDKPIKLRLLAEAVGVTVDYLEQISADLSRYGLIRSFAGTHGGHQLAKPASDISMADVIDAMRARALAGASSGTDGRLGNRTPLRDPLEKLLTLILQGISLADVLHGDLEAHPLLRRIHDTGEQT